MDKKDIMYGVLALVIILVIALVIKPLATGQPVNIGLPVSETPAVATDLPNDSNIPGKSGVIGTIPVTRIVTTISTPPTPVPTWNQEVKDVGFVNPETYGITTSQTFLNSTRIDRVAPNTSMTTYAKFSGSTSGTTQIISIPFPYWELWYSVDPVAEPKIVTVIITPTQGKGVSASEISGSYSTVKPQFTLQVMDADDPNRIVRVITPPGGIDLDLWLGIAPTTAASSSLKTRKTTTNEEKVTDPRPWKEKFFEGQRDYYFIVTSQNLKSYTIDIRVPTQYIGKY
jgi:hypothetical protein